MRRYFYFLVIGSISLSACRTKSVSDYVVVIKPIGPSDVTRTTFYIALKKTKFKRDNPFTDEILTDEKSLRNVISFVEDNRPDRNNSQNNAGWGALEISEYQENHIIMDYVLLNKGQSKGYLRALINTLAGRNLDPKLIKLIKEQGLSEIDD